MSKVPEFQFEDYPPAKPANVANLYPTEATQASAPERILSCSECPWYQLNPWTHYPIWGAWCHHQMEHLELGSAACEEFQHGEVPLRKNHERVPQVQTSTFPAPLAPAPGERVLKTMDRTSARAARLF